MRSVKREFFESKVRLDRVNEEGQTVKFTELYVVDSMSFTECESRVIGYVGQYTSGEFDVLTESRAQYGEIFFSDKEGEDVWYKVKVDFITLDERTAKEKHYKTIYLVQGASVDSAKKNTDEALGGSMADYKIVSVSETAVQDIILKDE